MKTSVKTGRGLLPLAACVLAAGCAGVAGHTAGGSASPMPPSPGPEASHAQPTPRAAVKRLVAFRSDEELLGYLRELARARQREARLMSKMADMAAPASTSPPAAAAKAESADESVTNVQHAGVDEGGIVKAHGDHLVVLRRGRLFTVRIGDDSLSPVSMVDAFGPDTDPGGAWYDEMLVSDGTIVVVGYSYARGGTELGLFDLDRAGNIRYRATYHLRSNDYYSSRNYASRLLGRTLVFYTPLNLWVDEQAPARSLPALRKWRTGATESDFRPIHAARRVYRPLAGSTPQALHTVTTCDLAQPELSCTSTAVMGPAGRVFYVSPGSVYVWMAGGEGGRARSLLYRMPLDGGEPHALRVSGSPVDQFSFLEEDGHLNVLVRSDGAGDGMWRAEVTAGDTALLRLPLGDFGREVVTVAGARYQALPRPTGHVFQNRFVGGYLLFYGTGSGWGYPSQDGEGELFAFRYAERDEPSRLELGHGVDRIEALGSDAVVVGTTGADLHFTPIALGRAPSLGERYTRRGASQGELRSHGFFYKPEGEHAGLLGLPVRGAGRPGYEHLLHGSASIVFLRNDALSLRELGELRPRPVKAIYDGCRASCVDWYGNARPLFLRGRLFALLGYEIVEGELQEGQLRERRRVNFAPRALAIAG